MAGNLTKVADPARVDYRREGVVAYVQEGFSHACILYTPSIVVYID